MKTSLSIWNWKRSVALLAVAAILAGCGGSSATPSAVSSAPPSASPSAAPSSAVSEPLRLLAGQRYIGTAVALPQLDRDATYSEVLTREFSSVTPENAMKWGPVEPEKGTFDWREADAIVAFAQEHGMKVRGHTLVWHNQLPDWLTGGSFKPAELSAILQSHITTEVSRYAGKIYAWDVVNEVFNEDGSWRDSIWYKALGQKFVADAFRRAHAADPEAKLYINDYNTDLANPKSDALYALVKSLKAEGVPIDGVGFQAHFDLATDSLGDMAGNLKRFADLGVDVAVTELDARIPMPADSDALKKQADFYKEAVSACVSVPRCVGITVWGFTDKYSWVPYSFPNEGAAALLDSSFAPKPAYTATQEAFLAAKG